MTIDLAPSLHASTRVRHETRRRSLTVDAVEAISPRMKRIRLSGDMDGFVSLAPDDHIKLFFADHDGGTAMRDFTPRSFDAAAGTLTVDFALHEAGPATGWAERAVPGSQLEIGGPRGSMVVADDFDWYWLIGDETALPAIGRWVEQIEAGIPVLTAISVGDGAEQQRFETEAAWTGLWPVRDGADPGAAGLIAALEHQPFPPGDGFIFIAAESSVARALRAYCTDQRGHPTSFIKAAGYWKRGEADAHERIEG